MKWQLNPLTQKRWSKFKRDRLAWYSGWVLILLFVMSVLAPCITSDRPYVMKKEGRWYWPIFKNPTAMELGIQDRFSVDYSTLEFKKGEWAFFPPVRFNPYQSNPHLTRYPSPPTWENPLGTDDRGRDILARLLYGFRYSFIYAIGVWWITFVLGTVLGLSMGFMGSWVDLIGQRVVEVISSVPQFFLLIILVSIFDASLMLLVGISSLFGWISISYYMRAEALKIRKLEYVEAGRAIGLKTPWILFKHVLPNALTPLITFSPFAIAAGVTGLAALDYLGFGLTPPTPSWGELLNQAKKYFTYAWWLAVFPSLALFGTLTLLNFVGEGLRNAFDSKSES